MKEMTTPTDTEKLAQALRNAALALRAIHKRLTSSGDALVRAQAAAYASNKALDAFRALAAHESRAQPADQYRMMVNGIPYDEWRAKRASVAGGLSVPRIPTNEMCEAARQWQTTEYECDPFGDLYKFYRGIYLAMLAAAPQPAKESE